jgi:hypothetical protein
MARTSEKSPKVAKKAAAERVTTKPVLLSGSNSQIAKAYGDAPVQAYIAAMPGWKRDVGGTQDSQMELAILRSRVRGGSSASIVLRSTSK